VRHFKWWFIQG